MRCEDKIPYRSAAKARRALRKIKSGNSRLGLTKPDHVYLCDCGSYHLTSWPRANHKEAS